MNWSEISVKTEQVRLEEAAAIANMTVPYGIYIEDYSDLEVEAEEIAHIDLIDEDLLNKDRTVAIIHLYIPENESISEHLEYLKATLSAAGINYEIDTALVKDGDWINGWKKYFKPIEVGDSLVVMPSWEKYENRTGRKEVILDPGVAFGTGAHATTSLCLSLTEKYIHKGDRVLDVGCGSGILSIAACLLGADSAVGVDIDETAVRIAKENAEINGVSAVTEYYCGDLFEKVSGKYELVCANIVADVIIRLLESIDCFLSENAVIITSGIIDIRADDVKNGFEKFGFKILEELRKDNWYAFAITKSNGDK